MYDILGNDPSSSFSRPPPRIKQSKSEPIVQRHLAGGGTEMMETTDPPKHRKSRLKDIDKIGEKLRERSAPRSSLDESGSSRKSSVSSGRKKFRWLLPAAAVWPDCIGIKNSPILRKFSPKKKLQFLLEKCCVSTRAKMPPNILGLLL